MRAMWGERPTSYSSDVMCHACLDHRHLAEPNTGAQKLVGARVATAHAALLSAQLLQLGLTNTGQFTACATDVGWTALCLWRCGGAGGRGTDVTVAAQLQAIICIAQASRGLPDRSRSDLRQPEPCLGVIGVGALGKTRPRPTGLSRPQRNTCGLAAPPMPTLADISRLSTDEAAMVRLSPHAPRSLPFPSGAAAFARGLTPPACAAQLLHGAIHEMCGTSGRYAPGAKSIVELFQALYQDATAKGLRPEEVQLRAEAAGVGASACRTQFHTPASPVPPPSAACSAAGSNAPISSRFGVRGGGGECVRVTAARPREGDA